MAAAAQEVEAIARIIEEGGELPPLVPEDYVSGPVAGQCLLQLLVLPLLTSHRCQLLCCLACPPMPAVLPFDCMPALPIPPFLFTLLCCPSPAIVGLPS